jgi:hypothetical protein
METEESTETLKCHLILTCTAFSQYKTLQSDILQYAITTIILSHAGVTIRLGMAWMIGFIDTLYTPLWTTGNYSTIADLHTLQFTITHTH